MNQGEIHKMGEPTDVLTYKIIEAVYNTIVIVEKNPLSSRPYVFFITEEVRDKIKKTRIRSN
jgi:ABC-type hemin transport system ATPase subunit